jgi:hypothetical protein
MANRQATTTIGNPMATLPQITITNMPIPNRASFSGCT